MDATINPAKPMKPMWLVKACRHGTVSPEQFYVRAENKTQALKNFSRIYKHYDDPVIIGILSEVRSEAHYV